MPGVTAGAVVGTFGRMALDVADTMAQVANLPGMAVATALLKEIQQNCDRVTAHKTGCKRLAKTAAELHMAIENESQKIDDSELQDAIDDIQHLLEKTHARTSRWAQYSSFVAFFNTSKIGDGLQNAQNELDAATRIFSMAVSLKIARNVKEVLKETHGNSEQLREITSILRDPKQVAILAEYHKKSVSSGETNTSAVMVMSEGFREVSMMTESLKREDKRHQSDDEDYAYRIERGYRTKVLGQYKDGLAELLKLTGIPPTVKNLDGQVTRHSFLPVSGGVYTDVFKGTWLKDFVVAVKSIRNVNPRSLKVRNRIEREVNVWSRLSHPNVLRFLGIVTDIGHFIALVAPWQENGNISEFILRHGPAVIDPLEIMISAAEGMKYLHSQNVVHGNIKCANILVNDNFQALISDFGMSKIIEDCTSESASQTLTRQGSCRWLSPELILGEQSSPTKPCDIWAFAMTILEGLSHEWPWWPIKRDPPVIHQIMTYKSTPQYPKESIGARIWLTEEVWSFLNECWSYDPDKRPTFEYVQSRLIQIRSNPQTKMTGFEKPPQRDKRVTWQADVSYLWDGYDEQDE
ncbi:kinase-like domain-containing protein [Abortiporus biennis]|nr:kinase-like domain-containing protein [Abortiporus biennis]